MNITQINHQIEARPTPTVEQWDAARRCLLNNAPDLYDYLFGETS